MMYPEVMYMHRTQIMLEEKQYEFLKKISEESKKSISQVLREIVDSYSRNKNVYSLSSIGGIAEDREAYGKDHDKILYRKK